MPIESVTYQPNSNSLNAAYTPIIFRVKAKIPNATPQNYICPVVYCDVYVEGVYYKSLSRSQYIANDGIAPEYEFDIQDAIQELMNYNLPTINGDLIERLNNTIKKVYVKFRNSFTDTNGFNNSEQQKPTQGTSSAAPTSGAGTQSNEFYILNSVIQHEENQNLNQLLDSYKTGTWSNAFPLTKRPKEFKLCRKDSSHFPIVSAIKPTQICVKVKTKSGQIIDECTQLLEKCQILQNLQYSVVKDIPNNVQVFTFTWVIPSNIIPMPYEIKIYRRIHGSGVPWSITQFTVNPTPITSQNVILPFGKYDFVFEIIGLCKAVNFEDLPYFKNIGYASATNNPPSVIIRWNYNLGNEDRVCNSSVCNFVIENYATDPDNDIVLNQVFKSTDGATWTIFVANATGNTFSDSISAIGSQYYKVKVTDSTGNTAESNVLKYTKQVAIQPLYQKQILTISCTTTGGDGPTNYGVWCTGLEDFTLASVMGINAGYIRLKVDGGNYTFGLSKYGGGYLVVDQVLPVTQMLTASYGAAGQNPPSAYPWGYQSNEPAVYFEFEYSINGTSGWTPFQFLLDD